MATAAEGRQRERIVELLEEWLVAQREDGPEMPYVGDMSTAQSVLLDGYFDLAALADFIADGLAL